MSQGKFKRFTIGQLVNGVDDGVSNKSVVSLDESPPKRRKRRFVSATRQSFCRGPLERDVRERKHLFNLLSRGAIAPHGQPSQGDRQEIRFGVGQSPAQRLSRCIPRDPDYSPQGPLFHRNFLIRLEYLRECRKRGRTSCRNCPLRLT